MPKPPPRTYPLVPASEVEELLGGELLSPPKPQDGTAFREVIVAARGMTGRDANGIKTGDSSSPMLGCFAYFIFLELCGKVFDSGPSGRGNPTEVGARMDYAIKRWAPQALTRRERTHLYKLRCSIAHDFSFPARKAPGSGFDFRWDEPAERVMHVSTNHGTRVTVSVDALGDLAERIRTSILRGPVYYGGSAPPYARWGEYRFTYDGNVTPPL